jgi:hypothetical protein
LLELIVQFEREGYRPEALIDLVTGDQAQARWRSLRIFAEKSGHFLVTNGPYRLKQWKPDSVVLEAVRDITYPLGFGTFDRFVNPPRAVIKTATRVADAITVRADAEMILRMGRNTPREGAVVADDHAGPPTCSSPRYLLSAPMARFSSLTRCSGTRTGASQSRFRKTCRRANIWLCSASFSTAILSIRRSLG